MSDRVDKLLEGAVDLHVHPYPSPFPRRIDILAAARHAAEAGFRAIVVKSHHHSTATDVEALRPNGLDATGVRVFGAIALNNQVGGLNPSAVNMALAMGGKVVWFPTTASPAHLEHEKSPNLKFPKLAIPLMAERPIDVWASDGHSLKPEVHEILAMIAEADGILASGHMYPRSILGLFEAARTAGVKRMVVNHPNFVIEATKEEALRMAELGALVEHSLCMYDEDSTFYHWEIGVLVDWIRTIGVERSSLGSDLGQQNNPLPAESYRKIVGRLLEAGLTEGEVRTLVADNPARLLGLDEA